MAAARIVASAAVAAEPLAVALWMVHRGCLGSAGWDPVRLFGQCFALGVTPENRYPHFGRQKLMKARSLGFQPPETTSPVVFAMDSPV